MQHIKQHLAVLTLQALQELYGLEGDLPELQPTRKEFEGDLTLVVFPYLRWSKKKPEETARDIGNYLREREPQIARFNVVKGFLNLSLADAYWINKLEVLRAASSFGLRPEKPRKLLVEFSSPNTNKPLHLGHIRNIVLGDSVARILQAAGHEVKKVQIINDRGIHICKSMLAWQKYGQGETPQSSGMKGDHLLGKYYVRFDQELKKQVAEGVEAGKEPEQAEQEAPLQQEVQAMLQRWEEGEEETMALWSQLNAWVLEGFEQTYRRMGVSFDQNYYESATYLLGREVVLDGLAKGLFFRKDDGSVWCDLAEEKLPEKLLLRKDGTSVYMTQDIGTAIQRYRDHGLEGMIYTVGNEQDHHFKVLFAILKKLGYQWAHHLYHLSYGMVNLPHGKMKSREGTVVDADDLMEEMYSTARTMAEEMGKTEGMSEEQKDELYRMVGLGALKYYILKVDPRKQMTFNPEESVDFQGHTGPFIQYTHARIRTLLRKADSGENTAHSLDYPDLLDQERAILKILLQYPECLEEAAQEYQPSKVAQYIYDLVKAFNVLYQQVPILSDPSAEAVAFRLLLARQTGDVVQHGMELLGIQVPDRM